MCVIFLFSILSMDYHHRFKLLLLVVHVFEYKSVWQKKYDFIFIMKKKEKENTYFCEDGWCGTKNIYVVLYSNQIQTNEHNILETYCWFVYFEQQLCHFNFCFLFCFVLFHVFIFIPSTKHKIFSLIPHLEEFVHVDEARKKKKKEKKN